MQSWVAAGTVSWFGDAVFTIALAWTAVHLLAPALAGLVVGIQTLPQAVLTLAGGAIADRVDTRRIMLAGELGRIIVLAAATTAWLSGSHTAAVLFTVAVAFGIAAGLSNPARATLARQLVRTPDVVVVGGWNQIGNRFARLAGAPVGAILVAACGLGPAMVIDAATFALVAVVLITVIRPRYALPRSPTAPWRSTAREGISYLVCAPAAGWLTLGLSSLNVFVSPVIAVGVALRVARSGWGASWVGIAEASFALAAIAGSTVAIRWRRGHLATRAFWLLALQGIALTGVGVASRISLITAMVIIGAVAGMASVWLSGLFQQTIEPSYLGRVSAISQLGDLSLTPLMLPLFGVIVAGTSLLTATAACGVAMTVLCTFFALRPAIRGLC